MSLLDGLWAFWRLDEVAGATRMDASGNGRDLADVNGNVGAVPHAIGGGAGFSGAAGQYLSRLEALPPGSFTVSLWVQLLGVGVQGSDFWSQGSGTTDLQRLGVVSSNYRFATQDITGAWASHGAVPVVGFHYLAGVYDADAGTLRIYLDGAPRGMLAGETLTPGATGMALGSCPDGSALNLKGVLALCGLWTRALSADEVAALYAGGQGLDPTA